MQPLDFLNFWGLFFCHVAFLIQFSHVLLQVVSIINFGNYSLFLAQTKLYLFSFLNLSLIISNLHCFLLNSSSLSMQFLISWRLYPHSFPGLSSFQNLSLLIWTCSLSLSHDLVVFTPFPFSQVGNRIASLPWVHPQKGEIQHNQSQTVTDAVANDSCIVCNVYCIFEYI